MPNQSHLLNYLVNNIAPKMSHHVLLLGGHGKVAQLLTPLLLKRAWTVTSVIRSQEQVPTIKKLAAGESKGKLNVLVRSLEEVKSEADAKRVIEEAGKEGGGEGKEVDYVVWSAGAGGKGGPERTYAIDRDACIHFIRASESIPSITKFLLVSYLGSRKVKPSWWSDEEWKAAQHVNNEVLPTYYKAKVAADEELYRVSKKSGRLVGICLRPGTLTLEPAGKVELGRTKGSQGEVGRETVAVVADQLLAKDGVKNCWVDLLDGGEGVEEAVERVVREGVDCAEGEEVYNE
ncbi:hypothetical protein QBC40DRAFT_317769 [Triangularia verruculosa]|uniref:NAD(P)-binding domain-containing protein n=1 Tax=Triangularia verruculosa TaxID=2587418 RepID=A0AAN6X6E1_9PEZI|nr:hypothetical protein QBC40DRAFT_317769 [Triangularia verruculosa]